MVNDLGINSTGYGEKATKKPDKKIEETKVQEPTPPPGRYVPEEHQSPGLFTKLKQVFVKPKQEAPKVVLPETKPQPPNYPKKVKWVVPPGTSKVKVHVYDSKGQRVNSYTISNYITLRPGQTLEVESE